MSKRQSRSAESSLIANELSISLQDRYVQVVSNGVKTFDFSSRLWTDTVATCEKNECYRVLGIANSTRPPDITDGFEHGELFEGLGIDGKYRIAWVENNPAAVEAIAFIETVLKNRGVNARLFTDPDAAVEWLLR